MSMRPFLRTRQLLAREFESRRNVKVSVWWDFENCPVPAGGDALNVVPTITNAVRANGINGPLRINAFGDVLQLSKYTHHTLTHSGVYITHIPGGKNSADRFLLVDLMDWVSQNPPPAHLFLISGDGDFAGILHRLRMNNYNILLAIPGQTPDVLCSAATIIWPWSSLVKGECLSGKHFNHPPDGLLGSWYGNYKVTPEKLFSAVERSTSSRKVDIYEPSIDLHNVPKEVVKQIWCVLKSHPKGISIGDLRAELKKCDVSFRNRFYGHKTFSRFLSSTPHVELKPLGDGHFHVCLVPFESPKPFGGYDVESVTSATRTGEMGAAATLKLNGEDKNNAREANETPIIASNHEKCIDDDSKSFQPVTSQVEPVGEYVEVKSSLSLVERLVAQPSNKLQKSSVCSGKVVDMTTAQLSKIQPQLKDNKVSKTKPDSLKMGSKNLFDDDIVGSEDPSHKIQEKYSISRDHSAGNDQTVVEDIGIANYEFGNFRVTNEYENPSRKEVDEVCHGLYSLPVDDSLDDKKPGGSDETYRKGPTLFGLTRSWWQSWKGNATSGDSTAHQNKKISHFENSNSSELDQRVQTVRDFEEPNLSELDQNVICSGKPELFSSDSFWNDMESFIFTLKGSLIVSQSKNREDMAHKLEKYGPLIFRSLNGKDILQLVELLISEKKWLEERPSQTFPFRLIQPVQQSSLVDESCGANSLRTLLLNRASQSMFGKSVEHGLEENNQSFQHTRVSTTATETKYMERARNDILEDCQKLVSEILMEHPEGYSLSSFPRLFVDRYGYHVDLQKLGFQKLANFLQIMPGVKVDSSYIYPSVNAYKAETFSLKTEVTNDCHAPSAPEDDNLDFPWEELGPIFVNNSNQSNLESKLSQKANDLDTSTCPDYEPIVPDYDSSECLGDSSYLNHPEEKGKPTCNEQDSSLWQAQEVLHSSKEGDNSVNKSDNVDVSTGSLADLYLSTESSRGILSKENLRSQSGTLSEEKPKSQRGTLSKEKQSLSEEKPKSQRGTLSKEKPKSQRGILSEENPKSQRGTLSEEKPKSQKNYSFVAEPVIPNKEKMIDGILDVLSKDKSDATLRSS